MFSHKEGASLSARRVWIEIERPAEDAVRRRRHSPRGGCGLKLDIGIITQEEFSHSPRGGCGLKFPGDMFFPLPAPCHSPRGGCGLKLEYLKKQQKRD